MMKKNKYNTKKDERSNSPFELKKKSCPFSQPGSPEISIMKVILTTNVKKLGKIGDKVSVKPGYARNYLFPNNMALRENKKNSEYYEKIKDDMKKNEEIKLNEAKKLMDNIKKLKIIFNKEADDKDQLYGSISKKEIIDFLQDNNLKVKSDDIIIKNQIKSIGEHIIKISPYEGIHQDISINVKKN